MECGEIPVRIINIGDEDVWLKPKSRIGTLHKVEVVRSIDDEYDVSIENREVLIRKIGTELTVPSHQNKSKTDLKFQIGNAEFTDSQKETI